MEQFTPSTPSWAPHHQPQPETVPAPAAKPSNAVEIVWQWVCYGLWQWTLLALSIFLSATLTYFLVHDSSASYEVSVYSMAAVICLLPIALVVERIYTKWEPEEKHGFAAVVLVLNALLVFLTVVGGLIAAAISIAWWVVNGQGSSGIVVSIISSLVVTALGAMLFVRIMRFVRWRRYLRFFPHVVLGVVAVTVVFSLAGPFRSMVATRKDRLIEDNLSTLNTAIQTYATKNSRLPGALDDLTLDQSYQEGAKTLVKRNLVTYKHDKSSYSYSLPYTLCVTFKRVKGPQGNSNKDIFNVSYEHGSGEQCYDLTAYGDTTNYNNSNYDDLLKQYQ